MEEYFKQLGLMSKKEHEDNSADEEVHGGVYIAHAGKSFPPPKIGKGKSVSQCIKKSSTSESQSSH